jgi:hypothetical protein
MPIRSNRWKPLSPHCRWRPRLGQGHEAPALIFKPLVWGDNDMYKAYCAYCGEVIWCAEQPSGDTFCNNICADAMAEEQEASEHYSVMNDWRYQHGPRLYRWPFFSDVHMEQGTYVHPSRHGDMEAWTYIHVFMGTPWWTYVDIYILW